MTRTRNVSSSSTSHPMRILDDGSLATADSVFSWEHSIDGLSMKDAFNGSLSCGRFAAAVRIEPGACITASREVPMTRLPPTEQLSVADSLHGNTRIVLKHGELALVADTMLDGQSHLPTTFRAIQNTFAIGTAMLKASRKPIAERSAILPKLDRATVDRALEEMSSEEPMLVRQEGEWELRVHLGGEVIPVRVRLRDRELALSHCILRAVPGTSAVHMQALANHVFRLNCRLRGSRLQLSDGSLITETRLHGDQLDHTWLAHSARAIATAVRATRESTRILAREPGIAEFYCKMFA